jgi:hypothetical protein
LRDLNWGQVTERSKAGFTGRNVGADAAQTAQMGKRNSEFIAPGFMRHVIDNWETRGSVLQIVVYALPVAPGKCRLLNRQVFQLKVGAFTGTYSGGCLLTTHRTLTAPWGGCVQSKLPRTIIGNLPKWLFHKQVRDKQACVLFGRWCSVSQSERARWERRRTTQS